MINPPLSLDSTAGFGGLIFSVVVGVSLVASLDDRVYEASLEKLVHALMFIGTFGFLIFPVVATICWANIDTTSKFAVVLVDVASAATVILIIVYYFSLARYKGFLIRQTRNLLPLDTPLDQSVPKHK